MKGFLKIT